MLPRQLSLKGLKLVSTSRTLIAKRHKTYQLVVVGAGSGGLAVASRFNSMFNKDQLAIIEPSDKHYYQPLFTLVGGGVKQLSDTVRPMKDVMPKNIRWIPSRVQQFMPEENTIVLDDGNRLCYNYLVVATGIQLDFDRIRGFPDAFEFDNICSNYSPRLVERTWSNIQNFKGGNALFTFPNTPIKCAGAPQKIVYLADDHFRQSGVRDKTNLIFNSALGGIFAVPKYAKVLNEVLKAKGIITNFKHNLIEVIPEKNEAIFENLDTNEKVVQKYDFLHVTPPQKPAEVLNPIADQTGFVDVDKYTLRHKKYSNIFALGDCSNLPTSRTAAAVAAQCKIVHHNLLNVMNHAGVDLKYDGYTSCPLITSKSTCILAEFDYDLNPKETFPFDQGKERESMYFLKKDILPFIYWNLMLKGKWSGPAQFRKMMRFGKE